MKICSVPGCHRAHNARGLCNSHYYRWLTFGNVLHEQPIGFKLQPLTCSVQDCHKRPHARNLCHAHYQRWRTTGEVSPERPIEEAGRAWEARFWALVARSDQPGACWLWLGHINPNGYAQWQIAKTSKAELVHRIAYRLMYGEIDQTLQLDHLCKIRHCVNPDHLEQVTAKENNMRSTSPTAFNRLKTHCKYGHPFDVTNTLYRPNGGRACRLCKKLRRRRR